MPSRFPLLLALTSTGCLFFEDAEPLRATPGGDTDASTAPTAVTERPPAVPCPDALEVALDADHAFEGLEFTYAQNLNSASSPRFSFRLPEDTVSVGLTGLNTDGDGFLAAGRLSIDGQDLANDIVFNPLYPGVYTTVLPSNSNSQISVDVPEGGHCLEVQIFANDGQVGQTAQLFLFTRRGPPEDVIDLNLIFAGDLGAEFTPTDFQQLTNQIDLVWSANGGPTIGDVNTYTIEADTIVSYSDAVDTTGVTVDPDTLHGVDVFIFADVFDGPEGLLGFAGGIPGIQGTDGLAGSGVVVLLDGHRDFNGDVAAFFVGSTLAHEVGHQLGLNHTTEQDGSSTALYGDVPVCGPGNDVDGDGIVAPFECIGNGADNFMFWAADPSSPNSISAEQTIVLLDSPSGR